MSRNDKTLPDSPSRCTKHCEYSKRGVCSSPAKNKQQTDALCSRTPVKNVLRWLKNSAEGKASNAV